MSTVIGIDLGTSTTEAALYRDGKPEMILTFDGKTIVPSVVGLDDQGNWVVGERAKAQLLLSPERTAMEVKRLMGKAQTVSLGKQTYSPVDLSAKILEYVKSYAQEYLGEIVDRAVISVPAYFDDIQRNATIQAGVKAGFQVERIINEPTAAAMSYGLDHMEEESHILVYDLGGGTFDVTLLEMFEGVLEVKASAGDNELGGKDFDRKLMDELIHRFQIRHGINLEKDRFAMVRIRDEAEACKIALSTQDSYRVLIPMIAKKGDTPLELDETITVDQLAQLTAELMERTHHPIDVVLQDSGLSVSEIDRIILVGGSTRMPLVGRDIKDYLGIEPEEAVDPDLAVSRGAAVMAGIIDGSIDPEEGLVITDVNPYTLGIEAVIGTEYGRMTVIIPRNVTIPTLREKDFYTHDDMQRQADIRVFQGESRIARSNHFLGEFRISGIPPKRAGQEAVRVAFSYDVNGILDVQAQIVSTGKKASIQIDMHENRPAKENGEGTEEDLSGWKEVDGSEDYRAVIRRAERMLQKLKTDKGGETQMRQDKISTLEEGLRILKTAILKEDWEVAEEIESALSGLLRIMK